MNTVFFDIETTGLSKQADFIIELAAVVIDKDCKIVDTFSTFVKPEKPIPFFISQLTGISDATVKLAPSEGLALMDFQKFLAKHQCAAIAGHNIKSFDIPFINARAERYNLNLQLPTQIIDTLPMANDCHKKGIMPNYNFKTQTGRLSFKLVNLMEYYQLGNQDHRAINDVKNNIIIYKKFKEAEKNIDYGF